MTLRRVSKIDMVVIDTQNAVIALNHLYFTCRFILNEISLELSINKTQTFIYCSNCNVLLKINKGKEIHEVVQG